METAKPLLPPTIQSSPNWKRYRNLLRKYSKAVADHAFIGSQDPIDWTFIRMDLRLAKHNLDTFVITLLRDRK